MTRAPASIRIVMGPYHVSTSVASAALVNAFAFEPLANMVNWSTGVRHTRYGKRKKAGTKAGPGKCWLVARINLEGLASMNKPRQAASGSLLAKS